MIQHRRLTPRWEVLRRRRGTAGKAPGVGVVVPAYGVEAYLPACLDSLLAQTGVELDVVVVDDGSPDRCGEIAESYAARDPRVRVLHTENAGLGAARNAGLAVVRGRYLGFVDSDDVLPPAALSTMADSLERSGSDFVTASFVRWENGELNEPPWMRRLHNPPRSGVTADDHPEVMGDVLAWNKLFRREFWDAEQLSWPTGVRYEDQPTSTRAYLAGRFDVLPEIVYHWRIRHDGSSITQQRSSLDDLRDRLVTKRDSWQAVRDAAAAGRVGPHTVEVFLDRVLAGDLHRYFVEIPGCTDAWWQLLRGLVAEFWSERSLTCSGLPPVHRLTGWLVEQGRREDAAAVMTEFAELAGAPWPRAEGALVVPSGLLSGPVDPAALALRDFER